MLKRSSRLSKKDNEVSTRPNIEISKVGKQKNMMNETISGSTKKRKIIEDELITPRRSSRLMTVSPPKVKSTDARDKNIAVKKDATSKSTKKKEEANVSENNNMKQRAVRDAYVSAMRSLITPAKSKLRRSARLMSNHPLSTPSKSMIKTPRKGFNNNVRSKEASVDNSSRRSSVKREVKDVVESVSPSVKKHFVEDESNSLMNSVDEPSTSLETSTESVHEDSSVSVSPSKPRKHVSHDTKKVKNKTNDISNNVRKENGNTDVDVHGSPQKEVSEFDVIVLESTIDTLDGNDILQFDVPNVGEIAVDDQEKETIKCDDNIQLETEEGSEEPVTAAGNNGEGNPNNNEDESSCRNVFSMTEEEFMNSTRLVPLGPGIMAHFIKQDFENRYELAPKVHFASSADDWERFKNGIEEGKSGQVVDNNDDDDLEIVHEAIRKKAPNDALPQKPSMGNTIRLTHLGSFNSQDLVPGTYSCAMQNMTTNFNIPVHRLRPVSVPVPVPVSVPVSVFQPPVPEGFRHYEPSSYRDGARCGAANNLGWSTNTYTRNEVGMNHYGYRRAAEYPQASTMRVTDINFSRSAPNHDPPRVYDMRNFHYNGEKFPLYQPGFPVHNRNDVMEQTAHVPARSNSYHYPMNPNVTTRSAHRNLRVNTTSNALPSFFNQEIPYYQYAPHEFVQMTPGQNRNIFIEENQFRNYHFNPDDLNNSNGQ